MRGEIGKHGTDPGDGERLADSLELLADMGRDFARSLDIELTLEGALRRITEYLDAEGGALFLLEEDGSLLTCQCCVGAANITGLTLRSNHGIIGRCIQTNRGDIVRDVAADPSFDGSVDAKTGVTTRSILCAPLSVKDDRIGAIELINKHGGDGLFDDADLTLLQVLCSSAALAILNARMASELVEQEKTKRELELAAEIQRSLLPPRPKQPYPVFGLNIPARTVSGDFYDFFELEDGRISFCLGDVSGKGINAAMLMAKTASLYHCLGKTETRPGKLLARLNEEICDTATRGMFVTLVGGIYDPKSMTARIANAGHEPPLKRTPDGMYETFEAEAPPLGIAVAIIPEDGYPEFDIRLDGGALYLFSDGVTEGKLANGEMLGAGGVREILDETADADLRTRLERVVAGLDRGGDLHDDITILGIDSRPDRPLGAAAADDGTAPGQTVDPRLEYSIPARAARLRDARHAVRRFFEDIGYDGTDVPDIVLVIDEACQNIIRHGYGGDSDQLIDIEICSEKDQLVIILRDYAEPVDEASIQPRDLDDVRPGGLGVHFMRQIMDEVGYLQPEGKYGNVLRMVKKSMEA
ncbi:MAG: SpoIIE family protein phosphatase [Rhodospirillales bacterium]|jgi:sigma-B regulation protein RsbU (phosphoserine phosphatase)|nr:SpoIIE family protein phosphatase [Rhodospirillales bacterium]MDP6642734.1 SpoIIE family protein phosphatase [Rhodospirillales bacterium]MDP6843259.1 SpoIIE family protein phosphatase [Rhodospirillales bacterium]